MGVFNMKKQTYCCMQEKDGKFCGLVDNHKEEHKYYTEEELREP